VTVTLAFGVKVTAQPLGKADIVTDETYSEPSESAGLAVMFRPKLIDASSLPVVEPETFGWSACASTITRNTPELEVETLFSVSVAMATKVMSVVPEKLPTG
jgi:hypothetical protein